jgi:hypothetical protein
MLVALDRPGDADQAATLAREVHATARELGLRGIERSAARLLGDA